MCKYWIIAKFVSFSFYYNIFVWFWFRSSENVSMVAWTHMQMLKKPNHGRCWRLDHTHTSKKGGNDKNSVKPMPCNYIYADLIWLTNCQLFKDLRSYWILIGILNISVEYPLDYKCTKWTNKRIPKKRWTSHRTMFYYVSFLECPIQYVILKTENQTTIQCERFNRLFTHIHSLTHHLFLFVQENMFIFIS